MTFLGTCNTSRGGPSQHSDIPNSPHPVTVYRTSANWKRKPQTTNELNALHRNVSFLNTPPLWPIAVVNIGVPTYRDSIDSTSEFTDDN
ncbi:unnamed protein product [Euphydryas editha]|uniref:Uncharacterized protein n=1 Tax=Euphydryas editha TaxID=104508 RepID=A0AAU9VB16_EUPED|nr:unnamed protein product [Euphydryas editha]